ncbi:uncharacterized protein LOC124208838 [Daphnia pulex]|uniref:uncharacterized protein LOC124208838 n=1 Tax=Daphnia pulex TaxID=6669 RepID=UPI001EDCBBB8|nr:uncharacterized protein LOC124208838 [Daphnia pulex]
MANSSFREVSHIAKFNGNNFSLWKFGCWLLLEQHNLVGIVNGDELYPAENINPEGEIVNEQQMEDWIRRDILARNYLVATIETQQQRSLVNCTNAREMWIRLSAQHLQNAGENQHILQQRFFEYQLQPDHDIMSHITEIETMAIQLHDVGAPVTPLQIMTKIICTLPPSYRSFTTAWDSVPANQKTIALLTSRLLKEETMATRFNGGQQDSIDAAFFATQRSPASPEFRPSTRGRGGREVKQGESSKHHPYPKCEYCDKPNHKEEVCRMRLRDEAAAKRFSDRLAASTLSQ